jgi:hypothetical protein
VRRDGELSVATVRTGEVAPPPLIISKTGPVPDVSMWRSGIGF